MATPGAQFVADLERWSKRARDKLTILARQSVQELAIRTQTNTGPPIGPNIITGFLIGSWQPGVNRLPPPSVQASEGDGFISKDIDTELSVLVSTLDVGDTFYYVNNAKYAMRQNYGFTGVDSLGRHVHQPGKFFLQRTLAQWPQIVADVAADLRFMP